MRTAWAAFGARAMILAFALGTTACESGVRELVVGEDACRYCRMTIDDVRFGTLVKTNRGKIETFDSIDCLASFVASLPATAAPKGVWVADFEHPTQWLSVDSARFVHSDGLRSPMGRALAAFGNARSDEELVKAYGGRVLDWNEVQALVKDAPHQ